MYVLHYQDSKIFAERTKSLYAISTVMGDGVHTGVLRSNNSGSVSIGGVGVVGGGGGVVVAAIVIVGVVVCRFSSSRSIRV